MVSEYDDPDQWTFEVEPSGRGYLVYLRSTVPLSSLRYGPNGYGWHCWTAKGAIAKGKRELERYRDSLRQKVHRRNLVASLRNTESSALSRVSMSMAAKGRLAKERIGVGNE